MAQRRTDQAQPDKGDLVERFKSHAHSRSLIHELLKGLDQRLATICIANRNTQGMRQAISIHTAHHDVSRAQESVSIRRRATAAAAKAHQHKIAHARRDLQTDGLQLRR
jgi:hypothetical protein